MSLNKYNQLEQIFGVVSPIAKHGFEGVKKFLVPSMDVRLQVTLLVSRVIAVRTVERPDLVALESLMSAQVRLVLE